MKIANEILVSIIGKRYGKIKVESIFNNPESSVSFFIVICDCGVSCKKNARLIIKGKFRSCGCSARIKGVSNWSPLKHIYSNMLDRCKSYSPKLSLYYSGRGIKVCDRWVESFDNFYQDMGERPSNKHTLDRIDVNGNYCKENCRWATSIQQGGNKRNNVLITFEGQTMHSVDWGKKLGCKYSRVLYRFRHNISLTAPKHGRTQQKMYFYDYSKIRSSN